MNTEKGQIKVTIDGKEYLARPAHEAMARIEAHTKQGILGIANSIFLQKSGFQEIAATVYYCIKAENESLPWGYEEFEKLVFKAGILKYYATAAKLLTIMTTGETVEEQEDPNG